MIDEERYYEDALISQKFIEEKALNLIKSWTGHFTSEQRGASNEEPSST